MEALIFFVLGTITSVLVNLATPYIQKQIDKTVPVNRNKRIRALKEELHYVGSLHDNLSKFTATMIGDLAVMIGLLTLIIILGILTIFVQAVAIQIPTFDAYRILSYFASTNRELQELSSNLHATALVLLYIVILTLGIFVTYLVRFSRKVRKVRDFEQYEKEVDKRIGELDPNYKIHQ